MNTQKKYIGSKALIILLSLIIMLNGLGLIVAGVRVKNKKWKWFGVGYIVAEFLFSLTGIGVYIATVLYFISIIHTCLICTEYGRLLALKESESYADQNMSMNQQLNEQYISDSKDDSYSNKVEETEKNTISSLADNQTIQKDTNDEKINIEDLILSIGSASIEGEDRDNLTIQIIDEDGKVYRFRSKGNNIVSFQVGSGRVNSYL